LKIVINRLELKAKVRKAVKAFKYTEKDWLLLIKNIKKRKS
jgi:hypothetical protein